jgi:hypothetical protein
MFEKFPSFKFKTQKDINLKLLTQINSDFG